MTSKLPALGSHQTKVRRAIKSIWHRCNGKWELGRATRGKALHWLHQVVSSCGHLRIDASGLSLNSHQKRPCELDTSFQESSTLVRQFRFSEKHARAGKPQIRLSPLPCTYSHFHLCLSLAACSLSSFVVEIVCLGCLAGSSDFCCTS
jgi:hypothetical protein